MSSAALSTLTSKTDDIEALNVIVDDLFSSQTHKDSYTAIVKDQQALVDLIKNSGITLPLLTHSSNEVMTYEELSLMLGIIPTKAPNTNTAITVPIAVTPSLWKRTKTGAVQMWQGVGIATASEQFWYEFVRGISALKNLHSATTLTEDVGNLFNNLMTRGHKVIIELVGFHGQQGSANMQVKHPTEIIAKGNRTIYRQLLNELNSKLNKKLDRSGYQLGAPQIAAAGAFQMPIVPRITPMLAKDFSKGQGKRIVYPCIVQRKFDGVRCLAHITMVKGIMDIKYYSRKGVEYTWLKKSKINAEIQNLLRLPMSIASTANKSTSKKTYENSLYSPDLVSAFSYSGEQDVLHSVAGRHIADEMMEQILSDGWWLDGELYSHTLGFDRISGLARKKNRTTAEDEDTMKLGLRVYDFFSAPTEEFYQKAYDLGIPCNTEEERALLIQTYTLRSIYHESPYTQRYGAFALIKRINQLEKAMADGGNVSPGCVELTDNFWVEKEEQLKPIHDHFISEGFEGLMLRNLDMPYEFSRSWNLIKYKEMKDGEFKIVDAEESLKGKQKGAIIWVCETKKGDRFNVVPNGTIDSRKQLWIDWNKNPDDFRGKELTVKYQELTPKGIPRFPKGIAIRDYE